MQTNIMHALHTQAGVSGARGILPGVFTGGLEDLLERVLSGQSSAAGVRYFPPLSTCDAHDGGRPSAICVTYTCLLWSAADCQLRNCFFLSLGCWQESRAGAPTS